MPAQVVLSTAAKATVAEAMMAFAAYESAVESVTAAMQQRMEDDAAKALADKAAWREKRRLAKLNRERRMKRAVTGIETLIALANQPSIQELMRQRTKYRGPTSASFHFYLAASAYDERARDQAVITLNPDSIEIEWGVPDADSVHRFSIAFDATERAIRRKLVPIMNEYPTVKPIKYAKLDTWKERDYNEGADVVYQVLIDCATPSRFEKYLAVALAQVAEDTKSWTKLPHW